MEATAARPLRRLKLRWECPQLPTNRRQLLSSAPFRHRHPGGRGLRPFPAWRAPRGKGAIGRLAPDGRGRRLSFGRAPARYFAKYLSVLTLFIGYVITAFTPRKQALHDLIAGTLVVRRRYLPALAAAQDEM